MATLTEGTRSNNSAMKRGATVDCRYLSGRSGRYKVYMVKWAYMYRWEESWKVHVRKRRMCMADIGVPWEERIGTYAYQVERE